MTLPTVRLIHWNAAEAEERAARLIAAGYDVAFEAFTPKVFRTLRSAPPSAVVIDLSRLPSQGRDVALGIRKSAATRHLPLVFVDGDATKVDGVKQHLPDATYTAWKGIRGALKRAIAEPPSNPVTPVSGMAAYAGTPLLKKLGAKQNASLCLLGAPDGFEETLGDLPEGVAVKRQARGKADLTIWFVKSKKQLLDRLPKMVPRGENAGLWIAWPKKASGVKSDITQLDVRREGLAAGLVDFKICSIDDTWSGLRFTLRK
jgi:hypothetical protein